MLSTSVTLLDLLRRPDAGDAWRRFVRLYTPLLVAWARRAGQHPDGVADLIQDVFVVLVRKLPDYQSRGRFSFRGWLKTVFTNLARDRAARRLPDPLSPSHPALEALATDDPDPGEADERQFLCRRAMQIMESDFEPATWRACWEMTVEGRPAADVARELGLSVAAVYVAKSRVLARLRQELGDVLD
jgi:RNA polymerase sigma-70 factor (ECF subfamily)